MEEVQDVVTFIPLDAAAGMDGFSAAFFVKSRSIIREELLADVNDLLHSD